ncbi:YaeQ family protein [Maricurvus nonylphenolicus]|uniref:YaeQ family protein n=1 Tax=Maricurvus nonylphenolicus TaxID=1008307 RepID=UPI0036F34450
MALKATIFKVELAIADMDRHYYETHQLTLARHPSENDERMMLRLVAFALNAHEQLQFTKGLSTDDEPDLWQKSLSDEIELWIDLGQPSEKRIRQACGKAKQVKLYTYGGNTTEAWWQQAAKVCKRHNNLKVINIDSTTSEQLAQLTERTMQLQVNIQDGELLISSSLGSVTFTPQTLQ